MDFIVANGGTNDLWFYAGMATGLSTSANHSSQSRSDTCLSRDRRPAR